MTISLISICAVQHHDESTFCAPPESGLAFSMALNCHVAGFKMNEKGGLYENVVPFRIISRLSNIHSQ